MKEVLQEVWFEIKENVFFLCVNLFLHIYFLTLGMFILFYLNLGDRFETALQLLPENIFR